MISAKVRSTARRSTPWKSRLIGWPVKRRGDMSPALRSATVGSVRAVRVTAAAGVRTVAVGAADAASAFASVKSAGVEPSAAGSPMVTTTLRPLTASGCTR